MPKKTGGIARGNIQRELKRQLDAGIETHRPSYSLKGRAKNYSTRYDESFLNLLDRMKKEGYEFRRTPGPRGGVFSETYRVTRFPKGMTQRQLDRG